MLRIITRFAAVVWCALSILPATAGPARVGTAVGERAPDFTLKDLDGNEVRLQDFRGRQAVLLVVGASW